MTTLTPATPEDVQAAVREHRRLLPCGGGSKPALSKPVGDDVTLLDLSALAAVLEYEPDEYTFTALAGTPLAKVQALLAEHNQYLPFDPPFAPRGATLGGTVAGNTAGPGRYRYGGVRDFLLSIRFVDGTAALVRGGSKVVKNAAGFDLPKLFVGSMGRLGVLVELTSKVFPRPPQYATLKVDYPTLNDALHALQHLARAPFDIHALDLTPPAVLWVRIGGLPAVLPARLDNLRAALGAGDVLAAADEAEVWQAARELSWAAPDAALVKVPLTPQRIPALDAALERHAARRRYSVGGNLAWVAWPAPLNKLDALLTAQGLSAVALLGANPTGRPILGKQPDATFMRYIKQALDPGGRFLEL